jgi:hypothetical protein
MSVYDSIREGIAEDIRKANSYDYVKNILTEILQEKGEQGLGYRLYARGMDCINNTPSVRERNSDQ